MTNIRNALIQSAGSAGGDKVYVEDVFSTFLYTGNSSVRSIDNNIDLSGEGGLVWIKDRSSAEEHVLEDTVRGATKGLRSNATNGEHTDTSSVTSFDNDGFSLGTGYSYFSTNYSGREYASWTLRKQEGFFDVQTASLDSSGFAQFNHGLGSAPGMVLVKPQNFVDDWYVYHKSTGTGKYLVLNSQAAAATFTAWGNVSATTFDANIGFGSPSGKTVVAYFFADGNDSNAQIFGDDGDEAIIKTGSYIGNGNNTGPEITLGFEPQWVLIKRSSASGTEWVIADNMRGMPVTDAASVLYPNLTNAEAANVGQIHPAPTGFKIRQTTGSDLNTNSETYIYVAIRRGPMKEPDAGTDVYNYQTRGGGGTGPPAWIFPNPVDWFFNRELGTTDDLYTSTRLIQGKQLKADETDAAANSSFKGQFDFSNGFGNGSGTSSNEIAYSWRRYPKVFDVAVYTGDGSGTSQAHNLTVIPELKIIKNLEESIFWVVGGSVISGVGGRANNLVLDSDAATAVDSTYWDAADTATTFSIKASNGASSNNGINYVAFLFATLDGISKVGTYTGTGSAINVDCGFSGGARWVMVKRTDAAADWYIVSSGRGFGKYILIDSDADEVSTAVLDTLAAGFTVRSDAGNDLNANGGTYLYLAFS